MVPRAAERRQPTHGRNNDYALARFLELVFTRLVRLSYLAPDITRAILEGRLPRGLTADKLLVQSRLPLAWHDQRTVLGFA